MTHIPIPSLKQQCDPCPVNTNSEPSRVNCSVCLSPFVPDGQGSCRCEPGHAYQAPSGSAHVGSCIKCSATSILPDTTGYKPNCTVCPINKMANDNRTACLCKSPFIDNANPNDDMC